MIDQTRISSAPRPRAIPRSEAATDDLTAAMPVRAVGHQEQNALPGLIRIELSEAQVAQVARCAAEVGALSALLAGLSQDEQQLAGLLQQTDQRRFSHSRLAGLRALTAFPADGSYIGNAAMARRLKMKASTAHRYLATLTRVGLLEQDTITRRYRLAK